MNDDYFSNDWSSSHDFSSSMNDSSWDSSHDSFNCANGMPMIGGVDIFGNPNGVSHEHHHSSSLFSDSRDDDRHYINNHDDDPPYLIRGSGSNPYYFSHSTMSDFKFADADFDMKEFIAIAKDLSKGVAVLGLFTMILLVLL